MESTIEQTWNIDQFSEQRTMLTSSPFEPTNGLNFQLTLHPNVGNHFRINLKLADGNKAKVVRVRVELWLAKPSGELSDLLEMQGVIRSDQRKTLAKKSKPWISHEQLMNSDYLASDRLTIYCKASLSADLLEIIELQDNNNNSPISLLISESQSLHQQNMIDLLRTGKFSDITLVSSDGKHFPVHKNILAAHSPVFDAMFQHEDIQEITQAKVNIIDIHSDTLSELLRILYSGKVSVPSHCTVELFIAADKYQLITLKNLIEELLCTSVTEESVLELQQLADMHHGDKLKAKCLPLLKKKIIHQIDSLSSEQLLQMHQFMGKLKVDSKSKQDEETCLAM